MFIINTLHKLLRDRMIFHLVRVPQLSTVYGEHRRQHFRDMQTNIRRR